MKTNTRTARLRSLPALSCRAHRTREQRMDGKSAWLRHSSARADAALRFAAADATTARGSRQAPKAAAPMKRSHHAGKVSAGFAPECPTAVCCPWPVISPGVSLLCCGGRVSARVQELWLHAQPQGTPPLLAMRKTAQTHPTQLDDTPHGTTTHPQCHRTDAHIPATLPPPRATRPSSQSRTRLRNRCQSAALQSFLRAPVQAQELQRRRPAAG